MKVILMLLLGVPGLVQAKDGDSKGNGDFDSLRADSIVADLKLEDSQTPEEALALIIEAISRPIDVELHFQVPNEADIYAPYERDEEIVKRTRNFLVSHLQSISDQIIEIRTFVAKEEAKLSAKESMPMGLLNKTELRSAKATISSQTRRYIDELNQKLYKLLGSLFLQHHSEPNSKGPPQVLHSLWDVKWNYAACSLHCIYTQILPMLKIYFSAIGKILKPFQLNSSYEPKVNSVVQYFEAWLTYGYDPTSSSWDRNYNSFGNGHCNEKYVGWQTGSILSIVGIPFAVVMGNEGVRFRAGFCSLDKELEAEYQTYEESASRLKSQAYIEYFDRVNP